MVTNREDYIKVIYELGGEQNRIGTKSIATALKVSSPSVSEMIKKLVGEGYIEYESYKGVKLTSYGLKEALRIKKRHLLWEVFLSNKLGYDWEDVHEEAEILEHITSPKLEELLEKYLEYPKFCPHGTPIEDTTYIFSHTTLDKVEIGKNVMIKRLADEKDILRYIRLSNLNLGDTISVLGKDEEGSIRIQKDQIELIINQELSRKIFVNVESGRTADRRKYEKDSI